MRLVSCVPPDVGGPLFQCEHDAPGATSEADQGGGMGRIGVDALLLGAAWFLHGSGGSVLPAGDLDDVIGNTIEITGVILPASAELAPYGCAKQVGEDVGGFAFGGVSLALLWVAHSASAMTCFRLSRTAWVEDCAEN